MAKFPMEIEGEEITITNDGIWIDAIDGLCESLLAVATTDEQRENMRMKIGSFLGETVIDTYGGEWFWSEKQERWVVLITTNNKSIIHVNVFRKIEERIERAEGGILTFWWDMLAETINNESGYDVVRDYLSKA